MKTRTILCTVVFTLSFLLTLGLSQHSAESETLLVSVNSAGTGSGNGSSGFITLGDFPHASTVVSADGRFAAFLSQASDLVANDTNGDVPDVFVRDLKTGTTTLVSVNSDGTGSGNSASFPPVISADGRFVGFESFASDLVADDTNDHVRDVFVRDLKTGTTILVSVNSAGTGSGNEASFGPVISADRRFVAFYSNASDLVANDTNDHVRDVFVRDLKTGTTTLVSVNSAGTGSGNEQSLVPVISADGRFVAFGSGASDLVANDTNGSGDVFVRDLKTDTTVLVSVNSAGTGSGNSFSGGPKISADGRFVAFASGASNLVANDTNGPIEDVFVRDLKTGTTTLISVNSAGTGSGNESSYGPFISATGRFVAFESLASDLVANISNGTPMQNLFVRDLKTGTTTLASVNSAGTDGGNEPSFTPVISANGRFVAFDSLASDLVANDTNSVGDVFVRDLKTGTTTLVSVNSAGTGSGNSFSGFPAISADGRVVAFQSSASDLVANDANGLYDVFVRRLKN